MTSLDTDGQADVAELVTVDVEGADADALINYVNALAEMAQQNGDEPQPIAAGTFAMYPMPDGGVMFVTDCPTGPVQGIKHTRIPPSLIRATMVLAGGGSKFSALKALMGGRKAIGDGR